MKSLFCALLILACVVPVRADEALQNGDFSSGIDHWHGDGRSPVDFASDNPLQAADPFTSAGLIVPLKHISWSMAALAIPPGNGTLVILGVSINDH